MSDTKDISSKLLKSCDELFSKNILNDTQYLKCKNEIGDNGTFLKNQIFEKKIIGNNRNEREKTFNTFISKLELLIDNIFKKINPNNESEDRVFQQLKKEEYKKYENILVLINNVINFIINNIIKKSSNKYNEKEKKQYYDLVNLYQSIDNNRIEMNSLKEKHLQYEQIELHKKDIYNKYKFTNNILFTITLILGFILLLFFITLFLVIYFK